jgi:hypothetical protein
MASAAAAAAGGGGGAGGGGAAARAVAAVAAAADPNIEGIDYTNPQYIYGYYEDIIKPKDNLGDDYYTILIQRVQNSTHTFFIDTLTGNYFKSPIDVVLDVPGIITRLIEPRLKLLITRVGYIYTPDGLKYSFEPPIKKFPNTIRFDYFKERCNPHVNLPVYIGIERYFVKGFDIEETPVENWAMAPSGMRNATIIHAWALEVSKGITTESLSEFRSRVNAKVASTAAAAGGSAAGGRGVNVIEDFSDEASEINDTPQSLKTVASDINIGFSKFTDPSTGIQHDYSIFTNTDYVEKTEDEFNKIRDRLAPEPDETTQRSTPAQIIHLFSDLKPDNGKLTTITDLIETTFGKHFNLNKAFAEAIKETDIGSEKVSKSGTLRSTLDTIPQVLGKTFEVFRFLRSYIDLYHDIETYAKEYCDMFKNAFKRNLTEQTDKDLLDVQIRIIDTTIFSKSGKINQEKCRQEIERITDVFTDLLHTRGFTTIPKTKESALVMSASVDNKKDVDKLLKKINADGVNYFFVESINNSIGDSLLSEITVCNLTIGDWDAGSGFTGKKKKIVPEQIGPAKLAPTLSIENIDIKMFDLVDVSVSNTNDLITVNYGKGKSFIVPRQKLSVNKLLTRTNGVQIRGTEHTDSGSIITVAQVEPYNPSEDRAALICLKTWTDLIQIETISKTMNPKYTVDGNPVKILTVIYDGLCETSARMYGLGHVLKTQGNIVSYYSYNIHSRSLDPPAQIKRLKLKAFIYRFKDINIITYIRVWFSHKIIFLRDINNEIYDPVLFFVSKLFEEKYRTAYYKSINMINTISTTDIKSLPDTIDDYILSITSSSPLLAELLEMISKFNSVFAVYNGMGSRVKTEIFINAYDTIQRLIVATVGNNQVGPEADAEAASKKAVFAARVISGAGAGAGAAAAGGEEEEAAAAAAAAEYPFKIDIGPQGGYGVLETEEANAILTLRAMIASSFAYMTLRKTRNTKYADSLGFIKASIKDNAQRVQNIEDIEVAIAVLKSEGGYEKYILDAPNSEAPINPAFSFKTMIDKVRTGIRDHRGAAGGGGGGAAAGGRSTAGRSAAAGAAAGGRSATAAPAGAAAGGRGPRQGGGLKRKFSRTRKQKRSKRAKRRTHKKRK